MPHRNRTTVICRAPHPGRHKPHLKERQFHGAFIAIFPFRMEPVAGAGGRALVHPPREWDSIDFEAGHVGFACADKDCKCISVYRILPPLEQVDIGPAPETAPLAKAA
jgi:hypothetical protein